MRIMHRCRLGVTRVSDPFGVLLVLADAIDTKCPIRILQPGISGYLDLGSIHTRTRPRCSMGGCILSNQSLQALA